MAIACDGHYTAGTVTKDSSPIFGIYFRETEDPFEGPSIPVAFIMIESAVQQKTIGLKLNNAGIDVDVIPQVAGNDYSGGCRVVGDKNINNALKALRRAHLISSADLKIFQEEARSVFQTGRDRK